MYKCEQKYSEFAVTSHFGFCLPQIMENAEVNNVIKIIGLKYNEKYENPEDIKKLRYGKVSIVKRKKKYTWSKCILKITGLGEKEIHIIVVE